MARARLMTFRDVARALSGAGISLTKKDGEYRVNFKGGKEATAYYTDSLSDAIRTARHMTHERSHGEARTTREAAKKYRRLRRIAHKRPLFPSEQREAHHLVREHGLDRLHFGDARGLGKHLRAMGFDESKHVGKGHWRVRCSQCQAMTINGHPVHERGCPNERRSRHDDFGDKRRHYWTVIIPPVRRGATEWHDRTEKRWTLSRGVFPTQRAAQRWAVAHLKGKPYRIKRMRRY